MRGMSIWLCRSGLETKVIWVHRIQYKHDRSLICVISFEVSVKSVNYYAN